MSPQATNENENRQQEESGARSFDKLTETNLLLIKTIRQAVPVVETRVTSARRIRLFVATCAAAIFLMSAATLATVRDIRDANQAFITALTQACLPKEANLPLPSLKETSLPLPSLKETSPPLPSSKEARR